MADREHEPTATIEDWWKPDPEDPFWMLESSEGEWLKNEHTQLTTRDPAKAIRYPAQRTLAYLPSTLGISKEIRGALPEVMPDTIDTAISRAALNPKESGK